MTAFVAPDEIRARFSAAMSAMYRREVPLYGDLLDIVAEVNDAALAADTGGDVNAAQIDRLSAERHGAIRVGTAQELRSLARVFAVMGMEPVGYYDLAQAGIPVHSTAFRPLDLASLNRNPFRVFTSLLRLDLIADDDLRAKAAAILDGRRIVSDACMDLVDRAENAGGLGEDDAAAFVAEALDIFRWHSEAIVDLETYERLLGSHRLVADIVSFRGPHINHLTPRTLDIDAAQRAMLTRGIAAKDSIEGPPRRKVPVLLRQTSFHALSEEFVPLGGDRAAARHTARFGEIEQRGAALTPEGRAIYDRCLARHQKARANGEALTLEDAFAELPDDFATLHREGLAYARLTRTDRQVQNPATDIEQALEQGLLQAEPITYEDFLPVSAAGIFRSNLGDETQPDYTGQSSQEAFEQALGRAVHDPFALYEAIEAQSRHMAMRGLSA